MAVMKVLASFSLIATAIAAQPALAANDGTPGPFRASDPSIAQASPSPADSAGQPHRRARHVHKHGKHHKHRNPGANGASAPQQPQ
jgi:hypothetical protein